MLLAINNQQIRENSSSQLDGNATDIQSEIKHNLHTRRFFWRFDKKVPDH